MRRRGKRIEQRLSTRFRAPEATGRILGKWHPSMASRVFGFACAGVFLVIGGLLVTDGARVSDRISGAVMLMAAPAAFWLVWLRPYLLLTDEQVVVQNAVAAFVIPLDRVIRADPGGYGLLIRISGRERPIIAMAVVKANLSFMLRRGVRADHVARAITAAARRAVEPDTDVAVDHS